MADAPPPAAPSEPPHNYLAHAICTTIFCCTPFGIVAIVKAASVNGLWRGGQYEAARDASRSARRWGWISFGAAIAFWAVMIAVALTTDAFDERDEATCFQDTQVLIGAQNAHFAETGRYASERALLGGGYLTRASGLHDIRYEFPPESYRIIVADGACGDVGDEVYSSS